jgi:hypothetical protein
MFDVVGDHEGLGNENVLMDGDDDDVGFDEVAGDNNGWSDGSDEMPKLDDSTEGEGDADGTIVGLVVIVGDGEYEG